MKFAFLFPGQGAQAAGMGRELYEQFSEVRMAFEEAGAATGRGIWAMCVDAEGGMLSRTGCVQPAMVALECALSELLALRFGIRPQAAAGLSLGEYAALHCAGALTLSEAVRLADFRGRLMEECAAMHPGGMAAVLGLGREQTEKACEQARAEGGDVWPCNYNCPGQIVIGGTNAGLERASRLASSAGAKRVMPLNVGGAFHTPLMRQAADAFRPALLKANILKPELPVYSNVNARPHGNTIRDAMERQIVSPVRWEDTLWAMREAGITAFVEVGPGKTLSSFVKKTLEGATVLNIEDADSLKKTLDALEAGALV